MEDRIPRHERGGVPIDTQAEVNQIEGGRGASQLLEDARVGLGGVVEILFADWHGVQVIVWQSRFGKEGLAEMRQIAIGMAVWDDTFVDLEDVNLIPWNVLLGESLDHQPGSAPTAQGEGETISLRNDAASLGGDELSTSFRRRIYIGKDLDLHEINGRLSSRYVRQNHAAWRTGLCWRSRPYLES